MTELDRLIAIEAIRALKACYFLHLDRKQWDAWRALFTDDAVMDSSAQFPDAPDPHVHILSGADAIVAGVSRFVRGMVTVHHGFTPVITIESADVASAVWAMEDHLIRTDGRRFVGRGHYEDMYRREGGAWRIARTVLHRTDVQHFEPPPSPRPDQSSRSGSSAVIHSQ